MKDKTGSRKGVKKMMTKYHAQVARCSQSTSILAGFAMNFN